MRLGNNRKLKESSVQFSYLYYCTVQLTYTILYSMYTLKNLNGLCIYTLNRLIQYRSQIVKK